MLVSMEKVILFRSTQCNIIHGKVNSSMGRLWKWPKGKTKRALEQAILSLGQGCNTESLLVLSNVSQTSYLKKPHQNHSSSVLLLCQCYFCICTDLSFQLWKVWFLRTFSKANLVCLEQTSIIASYQFLGNLKFLFPWRTLRADFLKLHPRATTSLLATRILVISRPFLKRPSTNLVMGRMSAHSQKYLTELELESCFFFR